jgi:hypothetical protein
MGVINSGGEAPWLCPPSTHQPQPGLTGDYPQRGHSEPQYLVAVNLLREVRIDLLHRHAHLPTSNRVRYHSVCSPKVFICILTIQGMGTSCLSHTSQAKDIAVEPYTTMDEPHREEGQHTGKDNTDNSGRSYLLCAVTIPYCDRVILQRVKVHGDAEGRPRLIHPPVSAEIKRHAPPPLEKRHRPPSGQEREAP